MTSCEKDGWESNIMELDRHNLWMNPNIKSGETIKNYVC